MLKILAIISPPIYPSTTKKGLNKSRRNPNLVDNRGVAKTTNSNDIDLAWVAGEVAVETHSLWIEEDE